MRPFGSRRRGPPAGRHFCAPRNRVPRRCPVFRQGGLLSNSLPVACEVLPSFPPPGRRGGVSSGFLTEPGCVTAAWPREPSGVLNHARRRCRPRSRVPRGCRPRAAPGGGAVEARNRGKKASSGATQARVGPAACRGWQGGVPHRRCPPLVALASGAAPPPAAERAAPAGASVAGSRPPRRVAASSSTSGAPAARGGSRSPPPADRPRSAAGPASGAGQPQPAHAARSGYARVPRVPRVSPSRGRRERGAAARASETNSCAAVPAPCPRRRGKGRPPGPVRRRLSGDDAPPALP